ncbi:hypothetical protein ABPG72_019345 [Tetrahymena utriculariae]
MSKNYINVPRKGFGYDYDYENVLIPEKKRHKLGREQIKNRQITSMRIDKHLCDNSISTSKYNYINFVPKNLIEQFSKIANLYFLVIGFFQIIPQISISEGIPTIFLPLFVILVVTAAKDFYEDYKRHKSDNEENNRKTKKWDIQNNTFEEVEWAKLYVGDVILVEDKDFLPADILVLTTSEPKGLCYIETKSLDGETNLKQRNAHKDIYQYYGPQYKQANDKIVVFSYELPNPLLHKFKGTCSFTGIQASIDINNFLLRGCKLKNTKWVLGLVAYTGHDTKIMKNNFNARAKKSHLEKTMGNQIILIFVVQLVLCFFCSLYYMIWYNSNANYLPYLAIKQDQVQDNSDYYNFFVRFGNWILIFNNFVPISLLVTLEMVKFFQAIIINFDSQMVYTCVDEKGETIITPTSVQSSNLNEELGQIEYIFSDKTGTLTCNIMEFKKISINGISYGEPQQREHPNYMEDISGFPKVTNVDFRDQSFFTAFKNENHPEYLKIKKTLEILALTHTVITEEKEENGKKEIIYNAASPDELALVNFAKYCGVEYKGIDEQQNLIYTFKGENRQVKQLHVFDFDSTRKRQSVVIQDLKTGKYFLYTKGADSVLFSLMDKQKSSKIQETEKNLDDYGNIGLRTLLLCEKEISNEEYQSWSKQYHEACTTIENREERMTEVQALLEKDLILVGATAIEDKLQDQVGQTIHALKSAGIKVWVLTGDKVETAINIGFSCKLLSHDLNQHIVKLRKDVEDKPEEIIKSDILKQLRDIKRQIEKNIDEQNKVKDNNAFIITGEALVHAMVEGPRTLLLTITNNCTSVLCCRVSPKQKQQIVSLVRDNKPNVSTLAIGDGANDVNMICAAHVGVGIKGLEGQQAARASDYSIGEFKILRNLLFFHGRESYRRNSKLVCYNFYKNIVLVLPQFFYSFYNNFSGQTLYDSYIYQLFNVFYASLPIIIYAVYDYEFDYKVLLENKKNYYLQGLKHQLFNTQVFWAWFFSGVCQSVILAFFSYQSLEFSFSDSKGKTLGFWDSGTMVFGMAVVNANLKVLIISYEHSLGSLIINFGSMAFYLLTLVIISSTFTFSFIYGLFNDFIKSPDLHIGNILIIASTSMLDYFLELWDRWNKQIQIENAALDIDQDIQYIN